MGSEGKCDERNEEGDVDSDAESSPRQSQISCSVVSGDNPVNGALSVSIFN